MKKIIIFLLLFISFFTINAENVKNENQNSYNWITSNKSLNEYIKKIFKSISTNPPSEYIKMQDEVEAILNTHRNYISIDFFTDDMVSYGTSIILENPESAVCASSRIKITYFNKKEFEFLKNISKLVFYDNINCLDLPNILNASGQLPTRFVIMRLSYDGNTNKMLIISPSIFNNKNPIAYIKKSSPYFNSIFGLKILLDYLDISDSREIKISIFGN